MTIKSSVKMAFVRLKVAVKKCILGYKMAHMQVMYEAEKKHEAQAAANAQFYKLQAGIIKYKLEDLKNAAKR